jgi:hypothetical protein
MTNTQDLDVWAERLYLLRQFEKDGGVSSRAAQHALLKKFHPNDQVMIIAKVVLREGEERTVLCGGAR